MCLSECDCMNLYIRTYVHAQYTQECTSECQFVRSIHICRQSNENISTKKNICTPFFGNDWNKTSAKKRKCF